MLTGGTKFNVASLALLILSVFSMFVRSFVHLFIDRKKIIGWRGPEPPITEKAPPSRTPQYRKKLAGGAKSILRKTWHFNENL